jgi:hypothetical protein
MRAVDCPCGEYLEGRNDSQLFDKAKQHATSEHEGEYSDADLRILIDTSAYDVAGESAS